MSAISQIAEERGISAEKVIETIEMAIAAAYKKEYGKKGQIIKCKLSPQTGEAKFWQVFQVVDELMIYSEEELEKAKERKEGLPPETEALDGAKKVRFNSEKHIMVQEAKKIKSEIKAGEELETPLKEEKDFGRIAAQTAKQVILQRIKETERETILEEYKTKEGEIVSGIVQRVEGRNIFLDVGKTIGVLTREEQVQGEFYRPGQRLKVYILKVESTQKGPVIFLSRAYPKLISKLFELEAPEIAAGNVVIRSIAREAGSRTKIAVESKMEGVDPIGSAVGQRGTRVQAVINELGGEKIDIIEYSEDPEKYIANSLSPAKVLEVKRLPKNKALVVVPEDQLSLAIGKEGQNVRLAAKLTGWKIDVRGPEAAEVKGETGDEDKSSSSPIELPVMEAKVKMETKSTSPVAKARVKEEKEGVKEKKETKKKIKTSKKSRSKS